MLHDAVVVGAGVAGLTSALSLVEAGLTVRMVAAAVAPAVTSSAAPAMFSPFRIGPEERVIDWVRQSLERLQELAGDPATGVVPRRAVIVPGEAVSGARPRWLDVVPGAGEAAVDQRPPGARRAWMAPGLVIETPRYLPWLRARLESAGVAIEERRVDSLDEEVERSPARVVVNCSGLGARELAGDGTMWPTRGQLVLAEPVPLDRYVIDETADAVTYVAPRRDATVIGATADEGRDDLTPDPATTVALVARARRLVPEVATARVVATAVGLRPCRPEVRLEVEHTAAGTTVVHNYGHGGAGFTVSWGCAGSVAALVRKHL